MKEAEISIKTPEEALCLIPHVLRYKPAHHCVVFGLSPLSSRGRYATGAAISFDIHHTGVGEQLAEAVCTTLRHTNCHVWVIALYVENMGVFLDSAEIADFADMLTQAAAAVRRESDVYMAAFLADSSQWVRVDSPLFTPRPWSDLDTRAQAIVEALGERALVSEGPHLDIGDYEPDFLDEVRAAVEAYTQKEDEGAHEARRAEGIAAWNKLLHLLDEEPHLRWFPTEAASIGVAIAALADPLIRDAILASACTEGASKLTVPQSRAEAHVVLDELWNCAPSMVKVERLLCLMNHMGACASDDNPHPAALSAFLAWWTGRNSLAHAKATQGLKADSDCVLARLMQAVLETERIPPWLEDYRSSMRSVA